MQVKRKLYWVASSLALVLFTAYAIAGVLGLGADKAYADAISKHDMFKESSNFVVVNEDSQDEDNNGHGQGGGLNGLGQALTGSEVICSLTPTQVAQLDAFFNVHTFTVSVQGKDVEVATVQGRHLTKHELEQFLQASNTSLDCQIVGQHHIFFFPVLPQIS